MVDFPLNPTFHREGEGCAEGADLLLSRIRWVATDIYSYLTNMLNMINVRKPHTWYTWKRETKNKKTLQEIRLTISSLEKRNKKYKNSARDEISN